MKAETVAVFRHLLKCILFHFAVSFSYFGPISCFSSSKHFCRLLKISENCGTVFIDPGE